MKTRLVTCFSTLIVALSAATAFATGQGEWQFLKAEENIHVWKLEIPGQDLPGFRGQTVIEGSVDDVMETMLKWQEHTKWMYRCKESLLVKRIDDAHAIMYNRTEAPWPVADRDVVLKSVITRSPDKKQVHLNFATTESGLKPEIEGVVRMPRLVGFYKLWQLEGNKTKVLYQVEADIGGSIPKWLSALAAQDLPYRTLSKLRERVEASN
jgi:hypothetical protein